MEALMAKTRVSCPNCRQPIVADIDQLFDVAKDPSAKQRLLSGSFNMVKCPNCGYQGGLATPIVYHDPQKELLLTYFPPELNVPRNEQEKLLGGLINQVVNGLTPEQRKGYLLRPQANLTAQSLVERVLEADGITKEVLQAQQQRLNLLQRLLSITDESALAEVIKQEDKLIDRDFFNIMNRLIEAAMMGGDQQGAQSLVEMQKKLIPLTTVGRQVDEQNKEVEAAVRSLEAAGKDLTREKLLDIIQKAPNDIQLSVITSLTRSGMDYQFFQVLSDRIDRARGAGRERLIELREKLLKLTSEIDKQMSLRAAEARKLLDKILQSPNITEATQQNLAVVDDLFVQVLDNVMEETRKAGDLAKLEKLQSVVNVLKQASTPPPELALIEELLGIEDDSGRRAWLEVHRKELTPEFMETMTALLAQAQNGEDEELLSHLQSAYRAVLRFSMETNLNA
jgi:hypothetical protein